MTIEDIAIRKRYEVWKRKKIFKRLVSLIVFLLLLVGILIIGIRQFGDDNGNSNHDNITSGTTLEDDSVGMFEEDEPDDEDDLDEDNEVTIDDPEQREPVVFCGTPEPEYATVLTDEEALSYLALVNRCYRVSSDFSPPDLSVVNVAGVNFPGDTGVHELRETAARALEEMFQEANEDGLILLLSSAYRSYNWQVFFHDQAIDNAGGNVVEARRVSMIPGHSEHQLGLGADLTTHALEALNWLDEAFSTTPEGIWVRENAHRFGFIISYPSGREADIGIIYEPWHIRYVGVEVATEIFNAGQVLEEYLWYNRR